MLAIACDKCRRRFTATDEELRVYLHEAEGKKYAQVLCPHCGKPNKVSADRMHQALRFSRPPEESAAPAGGGEGSAPAATEGELTGSQEETSATSTGGEAAEAQGPAQEVNPAA